MASSGESAMWRSLIRRVHQADQAARHHRMATEHRPHVNDCDIRSGAPGIQCGRQSGNPGADDDKVCLRRGRGGSPGFCPQQPRPDSAHGQAQQKQSGSHHLGCRHIAGTFASFIFNSTRRRDASAPRPQAAGSTVIGRLGHNSSRLLSWPLPTRQLPAPAHRAASSRRAGRRCGIP